MELYFEDIIPRNIDFQCVCQACYRKLAEEQFIRSRSKRFILLMASPPKKQLLYEKSYSNQPRIKLPTIVKIAVSFHTKFFLSIYNKSNISLSCFEVYIYTSLSTIASEPSS